MGYRSYTTYDCSVPDTTTLHGEVGTCNAWVLLTSEHVGDRYVIHYEGETRWVDNILDELINLFQMPLDKVPGLELHCHYETDEDGHWECELDIKDGECVYKESEIRMIEHPMYECMINLDGRSN